MDVTLKTSINTRAPLSERLPRSKKAQLGGGRSGGLCAAKEGTVSRLTHSTYQHDYLPCSAHASPAPTAFAHACVARDGCCHAVAEGSAVASVQATQDTVVCHDDSHNKSKQHDSVRMSETGPDARAPGAAGHLNNADAHAGVNDEPEAHRANGNTTQPVHGPGPRLGGMSKPIVTVHPLALCESQYNAQNAYMEPNRVKNFYANARKVERVHDDMRGTMVGNTQRTVDIRTRRAQDPALCPSPSVFTTVKPAAPSLLGARDKQQLLVNELDLVECTQLMPKPEYKMDFDDAPTSRLPGSNLSTEVSVQSKAITKMSTSYDMLRGSAKHTEYRPPGYAGHVPHEPRNEQYVTNCSETDARRKYAKSVMTLAEHGGGTDSSVLSNSIKAKNRNGKNSSGQRNPFVKKSTDINKTVQGSMLNDALYNTQPEERRMNVRDDKRGVLYF